MDANANLVAQLHDYKTRLAAEGGGRRRSRRWLSLRGGPGQAPRLDRRMGADVTRGDAAAEGALLQLGRLWQLRGQAHTSRAAPLVATGASSGSSARRWQGSAEEREALPDVYHAPTRGRGRRCEACEASADFRDAMRAVADPTDQSRIDTCRRYLLNLHDGDSRAAMGASRDLCAARRGSSATTGRRRPSCSPMPRAPGRAMVGLRTREGDRAADNGVTCFDETIIPCAKVTAEANVSPGAYDRHSSGRFHKDDPARGAASRCDSRLSDRPSASRRPKSSTTPGGRGGRYRRRSPIRRNRFDHHHSREHRPRARASAS